jgi:hypothetical protein
LQIKNNKVFFAQQDFDFFMMVKLKRKKKTLFIKTNLFDQLVLFCKVLGGYYNFSAQTTFKVFYCEGGNVLMLFLKKKTCVNRNNFIKIFEGTNFPTTYCCII